MKIILTIIFATLTINVYADNVLLMSDIHFNPYAECSTTTQKSCTSLENLIKTPINNWPAIFANESINTYKEETNNAFLTHGIDNLVNIVNKNKVNSIFITGDILSHSFTINYKNLAPAKYNTPEDLANFSYKTIAYVLEQLHSKLPNCKIYMALGNNDSDNGDYILPSSQFFKQLSAYLSRYTNNSYRFNQEFGKAGYFSTTINNKYTLIGLNANILVNGASDTNLANEQLAWLSQELVKAKANNKKVIIIQHEPFGINLHKTATNEQIRPVFDTSLQTKYLELFAKYTTTITAIYSGHFHAEYLSKLNSFIPIIGTLAFNSGFGNNPGFKIINLTNQGNFNGYTTYYSNLSSQTLEWKPLYSYSQTYGKPSKIIPTLSKFPYNTANTQTLNYRKFFNGNSTQYPQPISDQSKWKYYYCGIMNIEENNYNNCLNKITRE